MIRIFLGIVNAAITAGYVVLAVLALRLVMKSAPKWARCLLWGAVGLRLALPISFESSYSLIPSTQTLPADITATVIPQIHSGIAVVDKTVNPAVTEQIARGASPDQLLQILGLIWLTGLLVMAIYGLVSSLRLYRMVRVSVRYRDNVYICDDVASPFVLGILRPRIFLPSGMIPDQMEMVIAHEKAHLKRKDHWWKPLGYTLLAIYWFNPLLWLGYILLCRDIELACDEKVIRNTDKAFRKHYSEILLQCSTSHRLVHFCPLAFGEVSVKTRIKAVLHYKKPAFWILIGACVLCVVLVICFLTDPVPCEHQYAKKPACIKTGEIVDTCLLCGQKILTKEPSTAQVHDLQPVVAKAPTCDSDGLVTNTCSRCGYWETAPLEKLEHEWKETITVPATCSKQGERNEVCQNCDKTRVVMTAVDPDAHRWIALGDSSTECWLCHKRKDD